MDSNEYQSRMVEQLAHIKRMQEDLAVATARQIELLERLVALEHDSANYREGLSRVFRKIESLEEEVDNWRVMRKLVAWLGPTGLVGVLGVLFFMFHDKI